MNASAALLSVLLLPATAVAAPQTGAARAAIAQSESDAGRSTRIEERLSALEAHNETLTQRLAEVTEQLEGSVLANFYTPLGRSHHGLAPGASKIYESVNPLTIGGYGEAIFRDPRGGDGDTASLARAVFYLGYRFDENWLFNSAFQLLDTGDDGLGSPDGSAREEIPGDVQFAYLEYSGSDAVAVRLGLLLMPMGFVNEQFEPPQIYSAERPEIERRILPASWAENGLGLVSEGEQVSYRVYLVNGFDATGFGGDGLAGGRQGGAGALAEDLALVGRLDVRAAEGLTLGGSGYHGNTGQGVEGLGSAQTTIAELHLEYERGPFRGRALGVLAEIDDPERINAFLQQTDPLAESVGRRLRGYYVEAGYDVLHGRTESLGLIPFVRYEQFDTQAAVPGGATSNPANDVESWTFGVAVKPLPNLILRADYVDNDANGAEVGDVLRLSFGYVF